MNDYIWQLSGGQKHLLALAGTISLSPNILILDEPIAQLDPQNAKKIYDTLKMLNEKYNKTIIVIEHNLDLIKTSDYIIDLGPEGGDGGGEIIAVGTPEQICKNERSYTGKFLKKYLG